MSSAMGQVESIRRKVADAIGVNVIVAGGAVRDALMGVAPKDIDLFTTAKFDTAKLGEDFCSAADEEANLYKLFLRWEGDIGGQHVQIMQHPKAEFAKDLIDTFDWNVSRFAWDGTTLLEGMKLSDIRKGGLLELHRLTFPQSTLRRGYRFSERFGMAMRPDALRLICGAFLTFGWRITEDAAEPMKVAA